MSRNLAASIRARLKQRADATKQDFNLTLTHFGLERLLYRLSISPYAANYLLKGALLFSLWYDQPHRPTRDADLLGFGSDDLGIAVSAFRTICRIAAEDGIAFDPASVKASVIRKEAGYSGYASTCRRSWTVLASRCRWTSVSGMRSRQRLNR